LNFSKRYRLKCQIDAGMIEKNSMREAMVFFARKTSDSLKVDHS